MSEPLAVMNSVLSTISGVLWHEYTLYFILAVGVLFTLWSGFSQWWSMTHGVAVVCGKYDDKSDPGAINHFQALSAALSATVGIGNIGGVAGAIAIGGPGAVFWMWIVGVIGMALKMVECTLAMIYRNTDDPDNPHGGAMWVADRGLPQFHPRLKPLGKAIGVIFCITLLTSAITGGNMAQAFNVGEATSKSFGIPEVVSGTILAILCGLVIIGGIKMIGRVAGFVVPFMCLAYLIAGLAVLVARFDVIPETFQLIFACAFGPTEAQGAFLGGTVGYAFTWGMKRAFFSNEAGQGSAPIAHAAAKTDEPAREGLVAGIGPFIDTLVVCTITALVLLTSGAWNREPEAFFPAGAEKAFEIVKVDRDGQIGWQLPEQATLAPQRIATRWNPDAAWSDGEEVFLVLSVAEDEGHGTNRARYHGTVVVEDGTVRIAWKESDVFPVQPRLCSEESGLPVYVDYVAASLTSHAFNRVFPGLGDWLIPIAVWFFALSTVISWSYYGEQGIVYIFGERWVMTYRFLYCAFLVFATVGIIQTENDLANFTDLGTGVMLMANLPICLIFAHKTMQVYWDYIRRLHAGEFKRGR